MPTFHEFTDLAQRGRHVLSNGMHPAVLTTDLISPVTAAIVRDAKVHDVHGHVQPTKMDLGLARLDPDRQCLTSLVWLFLYHYVRRLFLSAEFAAYHGKWHGLLALPPSEERTLALAKLVHRACFIESRSAPFDEGRIGVVHLCHKLRLDLYSDRLFDQIEKFEAGRPDDELLQYYLNCAGLSGYTSTNDPFVERELRFYEKFGREEGEWSDGMSAALRLDSLVLAYNRFARDFLHTHHGVEGLSPGLDESDVEILKDFVRDWAVNRLPQVQCLQVSLPPSLEWRSDFAWKPLEPANAPWEHPVAMLQRVVFPVAEELGLPVLVMPEVVRGVTCEWGDAGDCLGKGNPMALIAMGMEWRKVSIGITPLNNSSRYEVAALTSCTPNVFLWGFWWHNLNPSLIRAGLRLSMEENGPRFLPMNSDARVVPHFLSKWDRFRVLFAEALEEKFRELAELGVPVTPVMIESTVANYFDMKKFGFGGNFAKR